MTLYCRPIGRGNWHFVTVQFHAYDMYRYTVGQRFTIGTTTLRIVKILY